MCFLRGQLLLEGIKSALKGKLLPTYHLAMFLVFFCVVLENLYSIIIAKALAN